MKNTIGVLEEQQQQRDLELSELMNVSIEEVQAIDISSRKNIRKHTSIYNIEPKTEIDFLNMYKESNITIPYLKSLMWTSIYNRGNFLLDFLSKIKNKKCLDFGSGVGTHAIILAENKNEVSILDVPSMLFDFAKKRLSRRGKNYITYNNNENLPNNYFDVVICVDVLEHVYDPKYELERIYNSMKKGELLFLITSENVKEKAGHFRSSIIKWQKYGHPFLQKNFNNHSNCSNLWIKV
jgi:2-polyprenyl-3-methyl-5-hydroxy-6-metoxy-1,4-benzoquinol methylase